MKFVAHGMLYGGLMLFLFAEGYRLSHGFNTNYEYMVAASLVMMLSSAPMLQPTPAARWKAIRFFVLFFAAVIPVIVLIKLAIDHRATLSPCAAAPWTFGVNLVPGFLGVLSALMATRIAYKLIRAGPLDDKQLKGRRVYFFYAGVLLVYAGFALFTVGFGSGRLLVTYQLTEHMECAAK